MLPLPRQTQLAKRIWGQDNVQGPAHYFDASGRIQKPEDFTGAFYNYNRANNFGSNRGLHFSPTGEIPDNAFQVRLPDTTVPFDQTGQAAAMSQPQMQQPMQAGQMQQPMQAGRTQQPMKTGMPQALGTNALMGQGYQTQDRRRQMMPLQGYQNALLRGF